MMKLVLSIVLFFSFNIQAENVYRGLDTTNGIPLVGSQKDILSAIKQMNTQATPDKNYIWELYVEKSNEKLLSDNFKDLCPECGVVSPIPKPRPLVPCGKSPNSQYAVLDFSGSFVDAAGLISNSKTLGIKIDNKIQARVKGFSASEETMRSIEEFCPQCAGIDPKPLPKPIVLGPCNK